MLVPAAAAALKPVAAAVMGLAAVRIAVTGVYEITASPTWKSAAGVTGLVLAAAADYAAVRLRARGRQAQDGASAAAPRAGADGTARDVAAQLDGVAHEAGVREQL